MSKKYLMAAVVAVFAISTLSGCAKSPPKCSDPEVTNLATKLFSEQIGNFDNITIEQIQKTLVISLSRASSFDEKIKKYSCEAKLGIGGALEMPIKYESQLDDKNELIVATQALDINRTDAIRITRAITSAVSSSNVGQQVTADTPQPKNTLVNVQCFSEVAISKAILELVSYKDVASSLNCEKEVLGAGKLICQNKTLKLMESLDTKAYVYAFENGSKSEADHTKPPLDLAWISSVRNECKDEACLCTAFKAHTNASLGGSSPYPQ